MSRRSYAIVVAVFVLLVLVVAATRGDGGRLVDMFRTLHGQ
jgi:hypothetical protein